MMIKSILTTNGYYYANHYITFSIPISFINHTYSKYYIQIYHLNNLKSFYRCIWLFNKFLFIKFKLFKFLSNFRFTLYWFEFGSVKLFIELFNLLFSSNNFFITFSYYSSNIFYNALSSASSCFFYSSVITIFSSSYLFSSSFFSIFLFTNYGIKNRKENLFRIFWTFPAFYFIISISSFFISFPSANTFFASFAKFKQKCLSYFSFKFLFNIYPSNSYTLSSKSFFSYSNIPIINSILSSEGNSP